MHQTLLPAALALAIGCPLAIAQPYAPKPDRGDLNADGVVDATDLAIMIGLLSDPTGNSPAREHADLTGDGKIDERDITAILEILNRGAGLPNGCDGAEPCCYELLPIGCCTSTECIVKDDGDGGGGGPGGIGSGGGGSVPGGEPGDPNGPDDPPNDPCSYVLCIRDADGDYISLTQVVDGNILYGIDDVTVYAVRNPDDPTPTLVDVLWYLIGDAGEDLDESAQPTSSYTLSADPGVWNGPGEYLLGTRCDNDEMTDRGGPTVVLYALRPKAITFGGGNHIIYPDNPMDPEPYNEPYEDDHWYDHNGDGVTDDDPIANPAEHDGYTIDRRLPVAYTRGTAMTIEEFVPLVDAGEDPVGTPYPGPGAFFYRATYDDPGGGDPTVFEGAFPDTPAVADTALPDHIAYLPFMQLRWEVSFDGEHLWFPIGTTNHEVYVTLDTPLVSTLRETLLYIGCRWTGGLTESTPSLIIDGVWGEFLDRTVRRQRKPDIPMFYYGSWVIMFTTTDQLLANYDGQCGAWTKLFIDVFRSLGLNWGQSSYVIYGAQAPDNVMWIANWELTGPTFTPPITPSHPYISILRDFYAQTMPNMLRTVHSDLIDLDGIQGQGPNTNPMAFFGNHQIALLGNRLFDASYGAAAYDFSSAQSAVQATGMAQMDHDNEITLQLDLNGDGMITNVVVPYWKVQSRPSQGAAIQLLLDYP